MLQRQASIAVGARSPLSWAPVLPKKVRGLFACVYRP